MSEDFTSFLRNAKDEITEEWRKAIIDNYPKESSRFFLDIKDRFANPIGWTLEETLPKLFDIALSGEIDEEQARKVLEPFVQIRAVQNATPAEAVNFALLLKKVYRKAVLDKIDSPETAARLLEFESAIDKLYSLTWEIYLERKTLLEQIRASEKMKIYGKMLDRLNRKYDALEFKEREL